MLQIPHHLRNYTILGDNSGSQKMKPTSISYIMNYHQHYYFLSYLQWNNLKPQIYWSDGSIPLCTPGHKFNNAWVCSYCFWFMLQWIVTTDELCKAGMSWYKSIRGFVLKVWLWNSWLLWRTSGILWACVTRCCVAKQLPCSTALLSF